MLFAGDRRQTQGSEARGSLAAKLQAVQTDWPARGAGGSDLLGLAHGLGQGQIN